MPYVPKVVLVIDRLGYAYCVPCADALDVAADGVYVADNGAADGVVCDGCGSTGPFYLRGAAGLVHHTDPLASPRWGLDTAATGGHS